MTPERLALFMQRLDDLRPSPERGMCLLTKEDHDELCAVFEALTAERDALTHDIDRLLAADAEHCTALVAAEARARDARAVLVHVEAGLNCRGENMTAHYCPNCDNSLYRLREEIRAALAQSKVTP